MTSEIVIMNKNGVAIAADSASTLSDNKIFQANKIFRLSKYNPVGILIYGVSTFMEVPWELIISIFREKLGKKTFDKLEDYQDKFIAFLLENHEFYSENSYIELIENLSFQYLEIMSEMIQEKIYSEILLKKEITEAETIEIIENTVSELYDYFKHNIELEESFSEEDVDYIKFKYKDTFIELIESKLEKLPIEQHIEAIQYLLAKNFIYNLGTELYSGIAFVGFGNSEIFPGVLDLHIYGIIKDELRVLKRSNVKIDDENSARIQYFAQGDMVRTFMEGISPDLLKRYEQSIEEILDAYSEKVFGIIHIEKIDQEKINEIIKLKSELVNHYLRYLQESRETDYMNSIMDIVDYLPKEEMAEMAESLIHLTSLKRRVSNEAESVGGPVDVAIISKMDGFIWIKRKYYFDQKFNSHYSELYWGRNEAKTIKFT